MKLVILSIITLFVTQSHAMHVHAALCSPSLRSSDPGFSIEMLSVRERVVLAALIGSFPSPLLETDLPYGDSIPTLTELKLILVENISSSKGHFSFVKLTETGISAVALLAQGFSKSDEAKRAHRKYGQSWIRKLLNL